MGPTLDQFHTSSSQSAWTEHCTGGSNGEEGEEDHRHQHNQPFGFQVRMFWVAQPQTKKGMIVCQEERVVVEWFARPVTMTLGAIHREVVVSRDSWSGRKNIETVLHHYGLVRVPAPAIVDRKMRRGSDQTEAEEPHSHRQQEHQAPQDTHQSSAEQKTFETVQTDHWRVQVLDDHTSHDSKTNGEQTHENVKEPSRATSPVHVHGAEPQDEGNGQAENVGYTIGRETDGQDSEEKHQHGEDWY
mmetsp:Transcript_9313/g.25991  ORF Transcript_9313/g.25991 Transcript_9313/m.25991 type:complete len:244 (+) Transcript_9313:81-812(+)